MRKAKKNIPSLDGMAIIKSTEYYDKVQMETEWGIDYMPVGYYKHVSFSRKDRLPTWSEVKLVKEKFFGDNFVFKVLPREKYYINLHPNCFHLFQYLGEKKDEI